MEKQMRRWMGERLRDARLGAKLTQQQVAVDFDRSRQAVSSWEKGKTMPSLLELRELCLLYGVSADRIILGVDDAEDAARLVLARVRSPRPADFEPSSF